MTDALVAQAKTKIDELRTIFAGMLVALPPEDAKRLFKVGLQRRGLPDDGLACAEANPVILPGTFNIAEQRKDVRSARNLLLVEGMVNQSLREFRDTRTLCEADGADWALRVYGHPTPTHLKTAPASRCGWTGWGNTSKSPAKWCHLSHRLPEQF